VAKLTYYFQPDVIRRSQAIQHKVCSSRRLRDSMIYQSHKEWIETRSINITIKFSRALPCKPGIRVGEAFTELELIYVFWDEEL
jgi:hypothetical protein